MKRKLGIVAECLSGVPSEQALELIAATGFETTFTGAYDPLEVAKIQKKATALGLTVEFIHAPFAGINKLWLAGLDYLPLFNQIKQSIDVAAENGIPAVILHTSSGWTPPAVCDLGLARFDELVLYAQAKGVTVAFENMRVVGVLACLIDRYQSLSTVRYCYDCGHEHCFTKTVPWMDLFTDRVVATHIHDNLGRGNDKPAVTPDLHLLPFDGNIDYQRMMRKLDEYGYEGSLMLEVFAGMHERYTALSPQDFLKDCYGRIQKIASL